MAWTLIGQAAKGVRDHELLTVVGRARARRPTSSNGSARG